ncbi:MAG TPA: CocE/NonD family hydrolase [Steroidobacteraceae bacterium]
MAALPDAHTHTEERDGMHIDWNVALRMADGALLRADVYRPIGHGRYPVILSYGCYAKGLAYQEGYAAQWHKMVAEHPEIEDGSSNKYQSWEVADPERWVPHGYALVRVDSRGAGWSEGVLDPFQPLETDDAVAWIEWAGVQPWSNGKVGMLGISYYAVMQWRVAERQPAHLAAIIPWEGFNDFYRDYLRHGGILSEFAKRWAVIQATTVQYGLGDRASTNANTGVSVAGAVTLPEEELARNRRDTWLEAARRPLRDAWYRARTPDLSKVTVPLLSCANWGGQGIHPRGNFNGFLEAASREKWLEVHGDSHWSLFSARYGLDLQRRFFDYYLRGIDNGWRDRPPVLLNVRHPGPTFVERHENEWPLARTRWTRFYLDPVNQALSLKPVSNSCAIEYSALGEGVTFRAPPFERATEITGPMAARLFVASSTADADLFLIVRVFDAEGEEVTFMGSTDPNTPIANGWLRASHRRLDRKRSTPYRPYHPHDRVEPLTPGKIYRCEVEILPSCIVVPAGWRLALTVRGRDYEYQGELDEFGKTFCYATRGTGGMTHNDPGDRPPAVFGGNVTLHAGRGHAAHLLLPIIPADGMQ